MTQPLFPVEDGPGRPWSELRDPEVLAALAGRVAERLGGCEARVAVSTIQLGLSARLVTAVLARPALGLPPIEELGWTDDRGSVTLLAEGSALGPLLDELAQLVETSRQVTRISSRLLWGNATSALHGVTRLVPEARPLASELERDLRLTRGWAGGRRTTCCLFYRVPGGGLCGDCVLTRDPTVSR